MAKSQMRSGREAKKPKKALAAKPKVAAVSNFTQPPSHDARRYPKKG